MAIEAVVNLGEFGLVSAGFMTAASLLAMQLYCIKHDIYSYWDLRWFNGPEFVFRYRDHTSVRRGRVGAWYAVLKVSSLFFVAALAIELARSLENASGSVIFLVLFCSLLIVPLIGFVIHRMSKEKYY